MLLKIIIEAYLVWIGLFFILSFIFSNKRVFSLSLTLTFMLLFIYIGNLLELELFMKIYEDFEMIALVAILLLVVISGSDIRNIFETWWRPEVRNVRIIASGESVENIIDSVFSLASTRTGALITIEKHNTLDPYAEKAIMLNSDISKELLINIFTPNSPLHDGAVIIRGDKILCAAAYFTLSGKEDVGKTTGSRHRAALGISEITDSLTVVVSEETGRISVAFGGILLPMDDKDKLYEYVSTFMK